MGPDGQSVDCPKAGGVSSVRLELGSGNDVAAVSSNVAAARQLRRRGRRRRAVRRGRDSTSSAAARATTTSSPATAAPSWSSADPAHDTAISDDGDARSSCEEIEGDADGDGVRRPADCDDTNPGIRPGVPDTPDDRVDQDCSGTDATNLDVDGDGSPRPQDCNDADPAIRPGARERAGNGVDENCDTRIVPFPAISGLVSNLWRPAGSRTVNVALKAKDFPKGTTDPDVLLRPGLPVPEGHTAGQAEPQHREPASLPRQPRARAAARSSRSASSAPGASAACSATAWRPPASRPSPSAASRRGGRSGTAGRVLGEVTHGQAPVAHGGRGAHGIRVVGRGSLPPGERLVNASRGATSAYFASGR